MQNLDPQPVVSVWLVEDDAIFRAKILDSLNKAEGLHCTHHFESGEAVVEALQQEDAPQVILMDIGLPGMDGLQCSQEVRQLSPASQIIILTTYEDEDSIFRAMCAGASGYLLKSARPEEIIGAVREVLAGGVPFTAPVARKVLTLFSMFTPQQDGYGLTKREKEVLGLMAEGYSQKEIAEELILSPHTIETHTRNIYAKLHVKSGTAAVAKAIKSRVI